jgi:hypothetical protein
MAYSRGTSNNIIVGAAALFIADTTLTPATIEDFDSSESQHHQHQIPTLT